MMNEPTTKAEAIRLANLQTPNMSNAQLKNFLRKKWNMHIESNQFTEVLGSECKRRNHKLEALKVKLAESFIQKIDHAVRKAEGGSSHSDNAQLMHPYCNSGIKESRVSKSAKG